MFVFDLEADGLLYDATKIHCICWQDENGNTFEATTDDEIRDAIELFNKTDLLVGHNICGYDVPLLEKLGYNVSTALCDTMIMSLLLDPDRPKGHSLESYAPSEKVQNDCWGTLTENMLERCRADVEITHKLFKRFSAKMEGWNWKEAMELEQAISYYHSQQVLNGVRIDISKARILYRKINQEIKEIEESLISRIGYSYERLEEKVWNPFKIDGTLSKSTIKYYGGDIVVGPSCRVRFSQINLNSFPQIKEYLLSIGWKPDKWTYKIDRITKRIVYENGEPVRSSPKITESSMEKLDGELGKLLARYFILKHRSKFIYSENADGSLGGIIPHLRQGNRVPADGFPLGTNTRRYRHRVVVNTPKAKDDVIYGYEIRDLFIHDDGMILMGTDADSLEANVAGHFCHPYDGGEFAERLKTTDVHQTFADYLKENHRIVISRQAAKGLFYGIQYGAQVSRIAEVIGCSQTKAKKIYDAFWVVNASLKEVRDKYVKYWKKHAYIVGIDGGKLFPRSEHTVMNTLFQSTGSIVVKRATVRMNQKVREKNLKQYVRQVIHMHDEYILEVLDVPSIKKAVQEIAEEAWRFAGEYYKLNVPITGTVAFGSSMASLY